ncbi:MAG TPA: efflux RND transporter periplasmic adaptor subunit [Methylomirabilota bacterium]
MRRVVPLALVVLLLLAGCSGDPAATAPAERPAVTGVRVETVALASVRETTEAVGSVRSKTQMLIASRVQGYVREVRARLGDHVEKGALLITVDERELSARQDRARSALAEAGMGLDEVARLLEEAQAALRSAEADHGYAEHAATRYRELWERQLVSTHEYEGVEARRRSTAAAVDQAQAHIRSLRAREAQMQHRIDQARAELRTADIALGDTRITAPATGVVVDRRVEPGDLAMPGQPLMVLDDPRVYRLEAQVAESAVGRVRVGQRVPVVLDALGRVLEGRVAEIIPAADPASRTVTVKLDLDPVPGLHSGLFGRAGFPAGERQALLVPGSALIARGQLTAVYVVDAQGVVRLRLVTAGEQRADRVEILSGLDAGERIVVEGTERVSDGARVAAAP